MSVVGELRQNDPANMCIRIRLQDESSDADLAQALEQNPFVTEIDIELGARGVARRLEFIAACDCNACQSRKSGIAGFIRSRVENSTRVCSRVFASDSAEHFHTKCGDGICCVFPPIYLRLWTMRPQSHRSGLAVTCDGEQGARSLAVALQRNTNIETLELSSLDGIYAVPILESLRSNTFLKTFKWDGNDLGGEIAPAHQRLLESTTSIQTIMFRDVDFSEWQFPLIAQAITNSECVSELDFSHCHFDDQSSMTQLQSILQNKRNLTTLHLHRCGYGLDDVYDGRGQLREDIISILSRPDSQLRCFEFQTHVSFQPLERVFPGIQFKNLLQAIQKSKLLERFSIGTIVNLHQLQTLTQSIPSMHMRELEIRFWADEGSDDEDDEEGEFSRETIRQDLLHAVKNNFSLRAVKAEMLTGNDESDDLFERAEDKQRLAFYVNRNESLDQWVDHPVTVEQQKLWPAALGLAERAGPDALFRGLHSVLGRDYVSLPGGRKRKRPQY